MPPPRRNGGDFAPPPPKHTPQEIRDTNAQARAYGADTNALLPPLKKPPPARTSVVQRPKPTAPTKAAQQKVIDERGALGLVAPVSQKAKVRLRRTETEGERGTRLARPPAEKPGFLERATDAVKGAPREAVDALFAAAHTGRTPNAGDVAGKVAHEVGQDTLAAAKLLAEQGPAVGRLVNEIAKGGLHATTQIGGTGAGGAYHTQSSGVPAGALDVAKNYSEAIGQMIAGAPLGAIEATAHPSTALHAAVAQYKDYYGPLFHGDVGAFRKKLASNPQWAFDLWTILSAGAAGLARGSALSATLKATPEQLADVSRGAAIARAIAFKHEPWRFDAPGLDPNRFGKRPRAGTETAYIPAGDKQHRVTVDRPSPQGEAAAMISDRLAEIRTKRSKFAAEHNRRFPGSHRARARVEKFLREQEEIHGVRDRAKAMVFAEKIAHYTPSTLDRIADRIGIRGTGRLSRTASVLDTGRVAASNALAAALDAVGVGGGLEEGLQVIRNDITNYTSRLTEDPRNDLLAQRIHDNANGLKLLEDVIANPEVKENQRFLSDVAATATVADETERALIQAGVLQPETATRAVDRAFRDAQVLQSVPASRARTELEDVMRDVFGDDADGNARVAAGLDLADARALSAQARTGIDPAEFYDDMISKVRSAAEVPDGALQQVAVRGMLADQQIEQEVLRNAGLENFDGLPIKKLRADRLARISTGAYEAYKRIHPNAKAITAKRAHEIIVEMDRLTRGGTQGALWYERSASRILQIVGGDREQAARIAELVAYLSRANEVRPNVGAALSAWRQYQHEGHVESIGRFPSRDTPIVNKILSGEGWAGRKTGNFYRNFLEDIDPERFAAEFPGDDGFVTVDRWILEIIANDREKGVTEAEYTFGEQAIRSLTKAYGWERPKRTQAAMWVKIKAEHENIDLTRASADVSDFLLHHEYRGHFSSDAISAQHPYWDLMTDAERLAHRNEVDVALRDYIRDAGYPAGALGGGAQVAIGVVPSKPIADMQGPLSQAMRPAERELLDTLAAGVVSATGVDQTWVRLIPINNRGAASMHQTAAVLDLGHAPSIEEIDAIQARMEAVDASGEIKVVPHGNGAVIFDSTEGEYLSSLSPTPGSHFRKMVSGAVDDLDGEVSFMGHANGTITKENYARALADGRGGRAAAEAAASLRTAVARAGGRRGSDVPAAAAPVEDFLAAQRANTRSWNLSDHDPVDLANHRVLLTPDAKTGVMVSPEGDLQNVFNTPGGTPGAASSLVHQAVRDHGAVTLDAYDGFLPDYYAQFGFVETGRMKFDPEYAPSGMPPEEVAKAPDIVFMALDAEPRPGVYYGDWDQAKLDSLAAARSRRIDDFPPDMILQQWNPPQWFAIDTPLPARGGALVRRNGTEIVLTPQADLTTVAHEISHAFMPEAVGWIRATEPEAAAEIDALLGIEEGVVNDVAQEVFAYSQDVWVGMGRPTATQMRDSWARFQSEKLASKLKLVPEEFRAQVREALKSDTYRSFLTDLHDPLFGVTASEGAFHIPRHPPMATRAIDRVRRGKSLAKSRLRVRESQGIIREQARDVQGPEPVLEHSLKTQKHVEQVRKLERIRTLYARPMPLNHLGAYDFSQVPEGWVTFNPDGLRNVTRHEKEAAGREADDLTFWDEEGDANEILDQHPIDLTVEAHQAAMQIANRVFPPGMARDVSEGQLYIIPAEIKMAYVQDVAAGFTSRRQARATQLIVDGAKTLHSLQRLRMYLSLRYITTNVAGTEILNVMHQGVMHPFNLVEAAKIEHANPDLFKRLSAEVGGGLYEAFDINTADRPVVGTIDALASKVGEVVSGPESFLRVTSIIHHLRRAGFRTADDMGRLLTLAHGGHAPSMRVLDQVARTAEEDVVRFRGMPQAEKEVFRTLFFVSGWLTAATRFTLRYPMNHPGWTAALSQVGDDGWEEMRRRMLEYTESLKSAIVAAKGMQGTRETVSLWDPGTILPFTTATSVLGELMTAGSLGTMGPDTALAQNFNAGAQIIDAALHKGETAFGPLTFKRALDLFVVSGTPLDYVADTFPQFFKWSDHSRTPGKTRVAQSMKEYGIEWGAGRLYPQRYYLEEIRAQWAKGKAPQDRAAGKIRTWANKVEQVYGKPPDETSFAARSAEEEWKTSWASRRDELEKEGADEATLLHEGAVLRYSLMQKYGFLSGSERMSREEVKVYWHAYVDSVNTAARLEYRDAEPPRQESP